jgi:hypothetical protein
MSGDEPTFRWDAYGISAYDAEWYNDGAMNTISGIDSKKFVRFDKNGIYGVNAAGIDGASWHPNSINDIDQKATFALTWEGLKVTGNDGVVAKLGKVGNNILSITKTYVDSNDADGDGNKTETITDELMTFDNDGTLTVGGWKVENDSFTSQSGPGAMRRTANPLVYISSTGREENVYDWTKEKDEGESSNVNMHSMTINANNTFMVGRDGTIFANAGYIGGVKIGSVASTKYADDAASTAVNNLKVGGRNLYVGTAQFSGERWKNLSGWEDTEEVDEYGNKIKEKTQWGGIYQEVKASAKEQYTLSATVFGDSKCNAIFFVTEYDINTDNEINGQAY